MPSSADRHSQLAGIDLHPPGAHVHAQADVTGLASALAGAGGGSSDFTIYPSDQHGIVSDGATDDAAAFQALMNLVSSSGGGIIRMKDGTTTKLGTRIIFKNGVFIDIPANTTISDMASSPPEWAPGEGWGGLFITQGTLDHRNEVTPITQTTNFGIVGAGRLLNTTTGDYYALYATGARDVFVGGEPGAPLIFDGHYSTCVDVEGGYDFAASQYAVPPAQSVTVRDIVQIGVGDARVGWGPNPIYLSNVRSAVIERVVRRGMVLNYGAMVGIGSCHYITVVECADIGCTGTGSGISGYLGDHIVSLNNAFSGDSDMSSFTESGEVSVSAPGLLYDTRTTTLVGGNAGYGTDSTGENYGITAGVGHITLYLPRANTVRPGKLFRVKRLDASIYYLNLQPASGSSDTINGRTWVWIDPGQVIEVISDGVSNWVVMNSSVYVGRSVRVLPATYPATSNPIEQAEVILFDAGSGTTWIYLPDATICPNGRIVTVQRVDTTLQLGFIKTPPGQLLDGTVDGEYFIAPGATVEFLSDGTGGWRSLAPVTRAAPVTLTADAQAQFCNATYFVDATAGNVTLTLPPANIRPLIDSLRVKKIDASANTVTIRENLSTFDPIDGAGTKVLTTQYQSVELSSNGVDKWFLV